MSSDEDRRDRRRRDKRDRSRDRSRRSRSRSNERGRDRKDERKYEESKRPVKKDNSNVELLGKRPEDFDQGTLKVPVKHDEPKGAMLPARAGGVYIPPFKLR